MYGSGENLLLHMSALTIMRISIILAYYTFKSNSLWPAAIYHSVHNIYIQKIGVPLTISNDSSTFWIDEYGFIISAVYFWRKANRENL